MMARPRSNLSSTLTLSPHGRRFCLRFRAPWAPAYVRSPASVSTIPPTVVTACASFCSCAVLFCASEWFRVDGVFGQLLHAIASGVLGLMSVVLPVLLSAVAIRLMRNSGKGSNNPRVVTGWVLLMWSVCSILDVVIASSHTSFNIAVLQSAGGLLGFFLGSQLAWGLSNVFAIIVFVVVGLFSLLMITGTHVTDIPEDARKLSAKIQRKPYVPKGQEPDDGNQFPNEVRVGDSTLAFAEGVPAHDSTDEESDGENKSGTAKPGLFARLFGRKPKTEDDQTLDRYAADDPFDRAASQHGATAETPVVDTATGEITGGRTIASSAYEGATLPPMSLLRVPLLPAILSLCPAGRRQMTHGHPAPRKPTWPPLRQPWVMPPALMREPMRMAAAWAKASPIPMASQTPPMATMPVMMPISHTSCLT